MSVSAGRTKLDVGSSATGARMRKDRKLFTSTIVASILRATPVMSESVPRR